VGGPSPPFGTPGRDCFRRATIGRNAVWAMMLIVCALISCALGRSFPRPLHIADDHGAVLISPPASSARGGTGQPPHASTPTGLHQWGEAARRITISRRPPAFGIARALFPNAGTFPKSDGLPVREAAIRPSSAAGQDAGLGPPHCARACRSCSRTARPTSLPTSCARQRSLSTPKNAGGAPLPPVATPGQTSPAPGFFHLFFSLSLRNHSGRARCP
jgi:hypothetical protein